MAAFAAAMALASTPPAAAGRIGGEGGRHGRRTAGGVGQRLGGDVGGAGAGRHDLDQPRTVLHDGVPQPEEQHGQLLLHVDADDDDGGTRSAGLVDGGAGQGEQGVRGEPVAELAVDVVGADDALGQLGPGVGGLVGEPGATDHADAGGPAGVERGADGVGGLAERGRPRRAHVGVTVAPERLGQPVGRVERLEVEAALVAQPPPVDAVDVDPLVAEDLVAARLDGDPAAHRAGGAGGLDLVEVPGPSLEAVRLGGEGTDRADLDGVAREVGRERVVGEGVDLGLVASVDEVDERVARHLLGEAGAAIAQDAALAIQVHEVADGDGLLEVSLLLDEAGLARAVRVRLVLQRALAALVADRAVERVVGEQELEDAVLGLLGGVGLRRHGHAVGHRDHARRLERGPRPVSISTMHIRHMPTGFIRGW